MSSFVAANSILLMAMGLNIILGIGSYIPFKAGVYSFAGVGFLAIGAFIGAWFDSHFNVGLWQAVLVCTALGLVLSMLLGLMLLSLRRLYLSVATLTFSLIIQALAYIGPFTGGVNGVVAIPQLTTGWLLVIILVTLLVLLVIFERMPVARIMTAVSEDELGAAVAGINSRRVRYWSFVASGVMYTGFGAVWVHAQFYTSADYFGFALSVQLLLYAAVGGMRSFWGTVVTAGFVTALPTLLGGGVGAYEPAIYGGLLLVTIVFLPGGLSSLPSIIHNGYRHLRKRADVRPTSRLGVGGIPATSAEPRTSEPCLSMTGLSRSFGGVQALNNVSLDIFPGEVLAIIGPNGAGKTTLINVVTGMVASSSGDVTSSGTSLTGWKAHRLARFGIARTLQAPRIFANLSYADNIALPVLNARMWRWPEVRGNWSFFKRGSANFDVSKLPYGDRRLLEIERALTLHPFCLFLDEPSAGMIAEEVDRLANTIVSQARSGCAVVLVEHNLRLVGAIADRVVVLASGTKIAEGTFDEVMADDSVRVAYLGQSIEPSSTGTLSGTLS
jgi:branched-chain amino acid transport system permease protein